jgi:hypothetical protein
VVDSDEENKLKCKIYILYCLVRHTSQKEGVAMKLEDLEIPDKMKVEELAELFANHLNDFYSEKQ